MHKIAITIVGAAALAGCVCQNCCDLETRVAALEETPAFRRARALQAKKPVPRQVSAAKPAPLKAAPSIDPALRTAARVRFDSEKIVRQWENDHGSITRVTLKSGVLSTNDVPKITINGTSGPTKYSKKAIGDALAHLGYWTQIKELLPQIEVENGRTAWDVWCDAAWFLEDDPVFLGALEQAKQTLGVTQEQLDAVLAGCIY